MTGLGASGCRKNGGGNLVHGQAGLLMFEHAHGLDQLLPG